MSGLILFFFFTLWSHYAACKILVPRAGIKPRLSAVEGRSLNHWTTTGWSHLDHTVMEHSPWPEATFLSPTMLTTAVKTAFPLRSA